MALLDVRDVESFVAGALRKLHLGQGRDEDEELQQVGVLLMVELAAGYDTRRAHAWSFSTYAGEYLPLRLTSAWHSAHENHSRPRAKDADGKPVKGGPRPWVIAPAAVSLDAALERPGFDERRLAALR